MLIIQLILEILDQLEYNLQTVLWIGLVQQQV